MQEGQELRFYWWSLYTTHHNTDTVFGDHSEMEVIFEIEAIRQSGNDAKKQLIKNGEWGGQLLFTHWLNYGLICVIEISSSNLCTGMEVKLALCWGKNCCGDYVIYCQRHDDKIQCTGQYHRQRMRRCAE